MRRVEACAKPFCGFARTCGRLCVHSGSFHVRGGRCGSRIPATLREWRFSHTPPLAETDGGMQVKTILNRRSIGASMA